MTYCTSRLACWVLRSAWPRRSSMLPLHTSEAITYEQTSCRDNSSPSYLPDGMIALRPWPTQHIGVLHNLALIRTTSATSIWGFIFSPNVPLAKLTAHGYSFVWGKKRGKRISVADDQIAKAWVHSKDVCVSIRSVLLLSAAMSRRTPICKQRQWF